MKIRIVFLFLAITVIAFILFGPIIISKSTNEIGLKKGNKTIVTPLDSIEINKVYIVFDRVDYKELKSLNVVSKKVIQLSNEDSLKLFKKLFEFKPSLSDMATCESAIYVYSKEKLEFQSSFCITANNKFGLQNSFYGWANATNSKDLLRLISNMKPCYSPILYLK